MERRTIISTAFSKPCTALYTPCLYFFYFYANWVKAFLVIRPNWTKYYKKHTFVHRMHRKIIVVTYNSRSNVKRRAGATWSPVFIDRNQCFYCIKKIIYRKFRKTHSSGRNYHPFCVFIWTEKLNFAIFATISL